MKDLINWKQISIELFGLDNSIRKNNIMKMEIKIEQGKLTVNGKTFREMNYNEKRFLNNYIQEIKYGE